MKTFRRIVVLESHKYIEGMRKKGYKFGEEKFGYTLNECLFLVSQTTTHVVNLLWHIIVRKGIKARDIVRVGTCGSYQIPVGEKVVASYSNKPVWGEEEGYPAKNLLSAFVERGYTPVGMYTKDIIFLKPENFDPKKYQCVDMETSGVYYFSRRFSVPAVSVSVVSDKMGKALLEENILVNKVIEAVEDALSI